ncbi:MAG TPA: riboflavin synthase [Chthonomonadales bacterium]|nr:riboflavin synthase [Chthonomonadales bacterium]
MFTGLVEATGRVIELDRARGRLAVNTAAIAQGAATGDSIAVNGCCLTVIESNAEELVFDVVPETFARTNLGRLALGEQVNLERPLAVGQRLGGHFVQGHIDGIALLRSANPRENAVVFTVQSPADQIRYMVEKGSVALDGVSLTVAAVRGDTFEVWIVPHTLQATTFCGRAPGYAFNLECDLIGKYVERLLSERHRADI